MKTPLLSIPCLSFALLATAATAAITPKNMVQPDYPDALMSQFLEGKAVIQVTIGTDGTVTDASVTSATEPAFGQAALAAARQWTFEPIREDGRAVSKKVNIPFHFNLSPEQKANKNFGREVFKPLDPAYQEITANSLPRRPTPVKPVRPRYPEALVGSGKSGNVRVRFTIDVDGKTINPVVLTEDAAPEFIRAALMAVIMTEYLPLTRDGRLVYVTMQRNFKFSEDMDAPKAQGKDKGN